MVGAFSSAAFGPAFHTGSAAPVPVTGGASPWDEKLKRHHALTAEKIRKAKDEDIERILKELQDDGVLPVEVMAAAPDYSEVRRLYADQLAQIVAEARAQLEQQWQQQQDEEELLLLLMMH